MEKVCCLFSQTSLFSAVRVGEEEESTGTWVIDKTGILGSWDAGSDHGAFIKGSQGRHCPSMPRIRSCSSVIDIPHPAKIMDHSGGGWGFSRILQQLGGQAQLGGVLGAGGGTLWCLVRMVECLVKQGTDCREILGICRSRRDW